MVDATETYDRAIHEAGAAAAQADPDSIQKAEALYRKALTVGEHHTGPFDLSLVPALTGLGAVILQRGGADEAAPILARALSIAEQQLGADHPDVVILLNDVSRLFLRNGAHAHAEPILQRLLDIKRAKGDEHPEVATVLASIASVRQTLGRHDEAEQLWRRVLEIRERTLAPNHIATASALEHLGLSCAARGKIPEALQLLQRALGMREITLGAGHPSLHAVRERIADLQLQASDDLLNSSDALPAVTTRPRLSVAPHLSSALTTSASHAASPPPPPPQPLSLAPRQSPPVLRLVDAEPVTAPPPAAMPMSTALALQDPGQAPASTGSVPYLDVLMNIKEELDETEQPAEAAQAGWSGVMGTVVTGLRRRRTIAIGATAAVVVLPAIGFAMASAMRANRSPEWVQTETYAVAPVDGDSALTRASAPEALLSASPSGSDPQKDSAPHTGSTSASNGRRTIESNGSTTKRSEEPVESPIVIERPVIGRLDSVARAINVPTQNLGQRFQVQLQSSLASAARTAATVATPTTPARRAQLIGNPPIPRYPESLANSRIGGEVRVRFDVDTLGRPVIASVTVVSSPHAALSESVKRAIRTMRFEPARSAGPNVRTVTETVEMSFEFDPSGRN